MQYSDVTQGGDATQVSATVEVTGHLMDAKVLTRVLDDVRDYGGDYRIERFDVGRGHDEESYVRFTVTTNRDETLQRLLMRLHGHGVNLVDPGEAVLRPAARDGVFPDDFYSTTNLETVVRHDGQWVPVEHPEMDCGLVAHGGRVRTVPVSDVRAGDQVVCGTSGVRVVPLASVTAGSAGGQFGFTNSATSSEKPQRLLVQQIAGQMREVKIEGGKVAWVAGPAVVHTGAAPALVALVEAGYVDVLFGGNALATHDVEAAMYGASLGVDLSHGRGVEHGHEHHVRAINAIRKSGSIAGAVEQGVLTGGIMHAMVRAGRPFVLVGSVRDDGPLPDVHTDVVEGQRAMRERIPGVGFVLMVATMLHSIATGNLLPASVPTVCVDINPATVTKLSDRGSAHATGVVTDIGLFLDQLALELVPDYRDRRLGSAATTS